MRDRSGLWRMVSGMILILLAFCLTAFNVLDNLRAEQASRGILIQIEQSFAEAASPEEIPEVPSVSEEEGLVDVEDCMGILEIPDLGLTLPVIMHWSYPNLKIAPCRYVGSVENNDLIIAGHNYDTHFGKLKELDIGALITFTDMDGVVYRYAVLKTEILGKYDIEEMEEGQWDLTLFTCTLGGEDRITVRCRKLAF